MTAPNAALEALLNAGDWSLPSPPTPVIAGDDPILPTRFRIGAAAGAAIAAVGVAANQLWAARGGRSQQLGLEIEAVAAALRSERSYSLDGRPAPGVWHDVSGFYPTGDQRWVQLHCNHPNLRKGILEILGVDDGDSAPVAAAVAGRTAGELEAALIAANLSAAMIRTPEEWLAHPHAAAVAKLPLLEVVKLRDGPPQPLPPAPRPLSGVRALDLTHVIAGPLCGRTLAEHGADVVRVSASHSYHFESFVIDTGHGKLSVSLDLRSETERRQLLALVAGADLFVQGFRPGALERLGLGVDDLLAARPGLIYVTLSAFSHAGPWSHRRGFDSLLQSTTGIAFEGGDGPEPKHLPAQALDYTCGYLAAFGALIALLRRAREGGSYLVRVSLAQTGRWIQSLGRVDAGAADRIRVPTRDDLAPFMTESNTAFGRVRHIAPVLRMSETPPRWLRPAAPFGTHPARWPE